MSGIRQCNCLGYLAPCLVNAITSTDVIWKWRAIPCTKCFCTCERRTESRTPQGTRDIHTSGTSGCRPNPGSEPQLRRALEEVVSLNFSMPLRYFSSKLWKYVVVIIITLTSLWWGSGRCVLLRQKCQEEFLVELLAKCNCVGCPETPLCVSQLSGTRLLLLRETYRHPQNV